LSPRARLGLGLCLAAIIAWPTTPLLAKAKQPKAVEDYVTTEVLGICPAQDRLVLLERTLDLPYRFDRVALVLKDLKPAKRRKGKTGQPSLKERGREELLEKSFIRRLKRKGLKPLYDLELADAIAARRAELTEQGCDAGVTITVDDALGFVFELAGTPYRFELEDDGKRITASCPITGPDAPKSVRQERETVLWYAESKLSVRPLLPERVVQVRVFAKASLITVVVRSVDPPRYDVPGVDYLFVFAL
jgi:hypothetical protein